MGQAPLVCLALCLARGYASPCTSMRHPPARWIDRQLPRPCRCRLRASSLQPAVAGIVMATAAQVTATDLEHCMRVICENIRANALPLAAASSGAITAEELWWGDVPRTTSCKDGFDYVIAADVVRDLRDAVGRARTCCATELCGASSAVGML